MSEINQAIAVCGAVLAVKAAVINLLTARARFKFNDWSTGRDKNIGWREDANMNKFLVKLFNTSLVTFLPSYPVERLTGCMHNIVENEPFFLALALALSMTNKATGTVATVCNTYTYARCVHSAVFLHSAPQPSRAIPYLVGLGCTFMLAFSVFRTE